jgi:hypothetical protein
VLGGEVAVVDLRQFESGLQNCGEDAAEVGKEARKLCRYQF